MRNFKKLAAFLGVACLGLSLCGCNPSSAGTTSKKNGETTTTETTTTNPTTTTIDRVPVTVDVSSDSLYVKKIENLSDDFIFGMDASSVIAEEQSGVKYYDFEGNEKDLFQVLAENGINYIRVRVWNDPYDENGNGYGGGNNDIDKCVEIGKRATKYGMKLLVNFHYSDFWADPSKQQAPKAWASMNITEKTEAVYEYTTECLEKLKLAGVDVGMVQVGNETTTACCGETSWKNICSIFNAGSKACREVFPDALVAVHFTNPETKGRYGGLASKLQQYEVDYDVFASSYYPYWHGTLENLANVLSIIADNYDKKVMIAETSYAYTSENTDGWNNTIGEAVSGGANTFDYPVSIAGQTNHIVNLVDSCVNNTSNCIGVFYWEGAWISVGNNTESNKVKWEKYGSGWASSYAGEYDPKDAGQWFGGCAVENQAFFDETGHPIESLKVWALMKDGNTEVPIYADGVEDVEVSFLTSDTITLPETVNVIYNDNSKAAVPVTWNFSDDLRVAIPSGGNKDYTITGTIQGGVEVHCILHVLMTNYIKNYSFEEGAGITPTNWTVTVTGTTNDNYKVGITNENPKTGKNVFHFWAKNADTAKFTVEQEVTDLASGIYNYHLSLLGGADTNPANQSLQNSIMYVKINDVVVAQTAITFTNYDAGYKMFSINEFEYTAGDKIVIGFTIDAKESGSWGGVDDILLNLVG